MNVQAYFNRIGIDEDIDTQPTYELLERLQLAHIYSVPYENLDIINGIPLSLEVQALYQKIVEERRGGFCFELNSLFHRLLSTLGFSCVSYFARFWRGESGVPLRRHRVIAVFLNGKTYIADVGIGSQAPRIPLLLEEGIVQEYFGEKYRFERDETYGWVLYEWYHDAWQRYFSFTEEVQLDNDFEAISYYCEHHPASKFNKAYMVAMKTETGRKSLDGSVFKVFSGTDLAHLEEDMSASRTKEVLETEFGLIIKKDT